MTFSPRTESWSSPLIASRADLAAGPPLGTALLWHLVERGVLTGDRVADQSEVADVRERHT